MRLCALLCLALVACHPLPPSPPDAGDDCDRAYLHLGDVGCEPPKPETGTWVDVCRNARRNGLMPLKCVNAARTFDAAELCGLSCTPKGASQ